jgi:PPP family 3-phenylpropionic acid transporter
LSGFYFFYFAALGSVLPYWPLYLQQQGFDPGQIGSLMAVMVGTKIVAPNLWGWIADHSGRPLRVIRWGTFGTAGAFGLMMLGGDFRFMAWATAAYSFFWNAALPPFEAITLQHLRGQPERYSRVRVWGSIGFIASVLLLGRALDVYPMAWLPYVILALLSGIWLMSLGVPPVQAPRHADQAPAGSFWRLLGCREVLVFLLAALLAQLAHGPYYTFFTVYLKAHGYSATQAGQLWSLGVVAEVALFWWAGRLLRRVPLRSLLLVSLGLGVLRWWAIAQGVEVLPMLLAAQLLHAATFGAVHLAIIHWVHHSFGGAHHAKGQALFNSVTYGVGGMLGSYWAGRLWVAWDGAAVFTGAALVTGLALLVALLGLRSMQARL